MEGFIRTKVFVDFDTDPDPADLLSGFLFDRQLYYKVYKFIPDGVQKMGANFFLFLPGSAAASALRRKKPTISVKLKVNVNGFHNELLAFSFNINFQIMCFILLYFSSGYAGANANRFQRSSCRFIDLSKIA